MEIIDCSSEKIKVLSSTPTPNEITTSLSSLPDKKKRLKIGITSQEIKDLFCNGLRLNNMLWYDFLLYSNFEST